MFGWYFGALTGGYDEHNPPVGISHVIGIVMCLLMAINMFFNRKKAGFTFIIAITLTIYFLSSYLAHKPYPTGRLLIPILPFVIVSMVEVGAFLVGRIKLTKRMVQFASVIIALGLSFNYMNKSRGKVSFNTLKYDSILFEGLDVHYVPKTTRVDFRYYFDKFQIRPPMEKLMVKGGYEMVDTKVDDIKVYYFKSTDLVVVESSVFNNMEDELEMKVYPVNGEDLDSLSKEEGYLDLSTHFQPSGLTITRYNSFVLPEFKIKSIELSQGKGKEEEWNVRFDVK